MSAPLPPWPPYSSWDEDIGASVRHALRGRTPQSLIAYSLADDWEARRIRLKAHFGTQPSEDDVDTVDTEILSEFLDLFVTVTEIEVVSTGAAPTPLPGGFAWRRGDPPWSPPAG